MKWVILNPSWNITAFLLVDSLPDNRQEIATSILEKFPKVEQVWFLMVDTKELMMAGWEFCGNAARAAVWYLLWGKSGSTTIRISGYDQTIYGMVDENSVATITVWTDLCDTISHKDRDISLVHLQWISHLIVPMENTPLSKEDYIVSAQHYLVHYNLLWHQAAGIMFVWDQTLIPIVRVRDMQTCIYENACGSGTIAYALHNYQLYNQKISKLMQPSGEILEVIVGDNTISLKGRVNVYSKFTL